MKNLRVLIVDDVKALRTVVAESLKKSSCRIAATEAANGKEAMKIFLKDPQAFDLITMDYQMPEMNGAEAVHQIRKKNAAVPIIGISSSIALMRPDVSAVKNIYFLDKPLETEKLLELLALIINHEILRLSR